MRSPTRKHLGVDGTFVDQGLDVVHAKLIEYITEHITVINQQVDETIDASNDFSVNQTAQHTGVR